VRVAVLSGGRSSEHDVSLESGRAVAAGLEQAGHEVVAVTIERDGRWRTSGEDVTLHAADGLLGADAAFPVLHGPYGEDGSVQGMLECLDIAYVGPTVLPAAVAIDKLVFKRLLAFHGIPQVDFCEAGQEGWREHAEAMGLPLWVKPSRLGSSVGISKVTDFPDLEGAVEGARRHDPRVIVEAHCDGREVECSVIGNDEPETSVPGEIEAHADWYDFEAKYDEGGMDLIVPARLDDAVAERLRALAAQVYQAIGGTGLARCDFFVTPDDDVLVNELNTIPGFTATSVFAKLFEATGISYPELCNRLVELAVQRHAENRRFEF
jgi:D-alanine-D-alanine ligase